nr:retrovirus-related Pol polyprotein from transposon TNT 1-94 [Tanacetum cinerariifolium]
MTRRRFKEAETTKASDSGEEDDEKVNNETCLVAQASSEVCSESSYFNDENSSIDDLVLYNEYAKLCKMSLKIITKNKRLKVTRNNLEKELSVLKEKVSTLEKNKGVDLECVKCHMLKIENEKLKEEVTRLNKFEMSTQCLNEMLSNQKPSGEKLGLGFNSFEASSSETKEIKFVKAQKKVSPNGGPINMGGPLNVHETPKANMGPPPGIIPGSEKRQICDNKCRVTFSELNSEITKDGKVIGRGIRKKGLYVMKLENKPKDKICLATIDENSTFWHRRLGHANMRLIQSLASKELVRNLPNLKFDKHFCDACQIGRQAHASHKAKNIVSTTRCLELLHMDLFGPFVVRSYGGNRYTLVTVDDYSRKVEESLNVTFDETPPPSKTSPLVDDDLDEEEAIKVTKKKNLENDIMDETLEIDEIVNIKKYRNHPLKNIIGNLNQRTLRSQAQNQSQVRRIRHEEEIDVLEYQILNREIVPTMKPLEEIIWENVFCLGVIMNENHELYNESYVLYDHVMNPLAAQQERKPRKDRGTRRGRHSTSSSSTFDQPSSAHLNDDDDDGNGEGTSLASTPSPIHVPHRPLNPQPLQSHPSFDITLSLSPITPHDHIHDTLSPPSPPTTSTTYHGSPSLLQLP